MLIMLVALAIALAIPVLVLWGIYKLDFFRTGTFRLILFCFGYGGVAYLLAALINPQSMKLGWVDYYGMVRFVAPIVEEILKSLFLIFLVRRKEFTYFIDGTIYGFSVGIGFAVFENFEYILGNPDAALMNAVSRVISTNLMHAASTAIIGILLSVSRGSRPQARFLTWIFGILIPIIIHTGYNNLVTRVASGWLLLYAVLMGGGAAGLIALFIKRGLNQEKKNIAIQLGNVSERVAKSEVTAVQNLDNLDALITPLVTIFGQAKAAQIGDLLRVQARLGILKNDIMKFTDEKMRATVQAQIVALRKDMDSLRKDIGSYAMLLLRGTYLESDGVIYEKLQTMLEQRSSAKPGGKSIYDSLQDRIGANKETTGG